MKIHALTIKIRAKKPKNARNCERSANPPEPVVAGDGSDVALEEISAVKQLPGLPSI